MDEKLTEDQEKALSELRYLLKDNISSSMYEDTDCLKRFLIARDYHVKKAESMIRKNLRWQKEVQLENIIEDFHAPEVLIKYFPSTFLGYDKEGSPIQYYEFGPLDEIGLLKSMNTCQLRKLFVQTYERNLGRLKPDGSGICSNILIIFNTSNITFSRFLNKKVTDTVMKIAMEFQDNYPERAKNILVINASSAFAACWTILKAWLGSSLIKKIMIFEEGTFEKELLKRIDADVLPAFLGGNRTDPDGNPGCPMTVNRGKVVPEEYFMKIDPPKFLQNPAATAARIGRQKQLIVPFLVTESNCIINWEFIVLQSYDIGFGLSLKIKEEALEEIIPTHKIETEILPERGMYRCKSTGSYFIIFDNSYSWIHTKDICYRIWATSAD